MGNSLTYKNECSAYPGEYVPMPEIEELLNHKEKSMIQPALNLDEFDNFFRVEVSLPGIHRQDIIVSVEDHNLTIKVIHEDLNAFASKPRVHEFDMNYFEREIALPEDADTEFTSAEYREGILILLIPKMPNHPQAQPGRIVVY